MKNLLIILFALALNYAHAYENPIISGFHPDPSVCRVGDDYYLVNSTFEYMPGVPIFHSKDLVNWQQIGNVLTRFSQNDLRGARASDGIYAPTIRYNNGVFYMITTLCNNGKRSNFYVTATDPKGPWSDPIFVDQSGIDPSLLFDDNGKVYLQTNRGLSFNMDRAIYQSEIDIKTGKRLTEPKLLWRGSGGSYIEGPHIYKINGYYYLLAAEGGTMYGHMVTFARSKSIWGPYESCPNNPVLSNRNAYEQIHGTGHADMFQDHKGNWWAVHLAFRVPQVLGRETCLVPVTWSDDKWPQFAKGTNSAKVDVPTLELKPFPKQEPKIDFSNQTLDCQWLYIRNPEDKNYSYDARKGYLRLTGSEKRLKDIASPTFVGRRQEHFNFSFSTLLEFNAPKAGDEAGVVVMMSNDFHYGIRVVNKGNRRIVEAYYKLENIENIAGERVLADAPVELKISGDKRCYTLSFRQSGGDFVKVGQMSTRFLSAETTGGYNGVILGIYATGNGKECSTAADFKWVEYKPL